MTNHGSNIQINILEYIWFNNITTVKFVYSQTYNLKNPIPSIKTLKNMTEERKEWSFLRGCLFYYIYYSNKTYMGLLHICWSCAAYQGCISSCLWCRFIASFLQIYCTFAVYLLQICYSFTMHLLQVCCRFTTCCCDFIVYVLCQNHMI